MKSYLKHIFIYPIKSLDGIAVEKAIVLKSGALKYDREWAIFDEGGSFVNGKRHPKVHLLRSSFDINSGFLSLQIQGTEQKAIFQIHKERTAIESWLSHYFGLPVKLGQDLKTGFPDDTNSPGPTIISTATIEEVASWFPGISLEEMRARLRSNLEIAGVPAFWEDRLFKTQGDRLRFRLGDVLLEGINPCQRCIVPTRDSMTGEAYPQFQKIFNAKRKETLPAWVNRDRFNHFYRLSVNTCIPSSEEGKELHLGDEVEIL